jgi:hypothetical protein
MIPPFKRAKTVHALDHAANLYGQMKSYVILDSQTAKMDDFHSEAVSHTSDICLLCVLDC